MSQTNLLKLISQIVRKGTRLEFVAGVMPGEIVINIKHPRHLHMPPGAWSGIAVGRAEITDEFSNALCFRLREVLEQMKQAKEEREPTEAEVSEILHGEASTLVHWNPMHAAPLDGTEILLRCQSTIARGTRVFVAAWQVGAGGGIVKAGWYSPAGTWMVPLDRWTPIGWKHRSKQ